MNACFTQFIDFWSLQTFLGFDRYQNLLVMSIRIHFHELVVLINICLISWWWYATIARSLLMAFNFAIGEKISSSSFYEGRIQLVNMNMLISRDINCNRLKSLNNFRMSRWGTKSIGKKNSKIDIRCGEYLIVWPKSLFVCWTSWLTSFTTNKVSCLIQLDYVL